MTDTKIQGIRQGMRDACRFATRAKPRITRYDLFTRCIGFFLAMAMPLSGMAPFGMSFLAQERKFSLKAIVSLFMVSLGCMIVCGRLDSAKYIGAGLIYLAVLFVLEKGIIIK